MVFKIICMSVLTPTKIKELCKEYGLSPSKKYGQNYLVNFDPIQKMLETAEVNKKDNILEIGPGFGVLTLALVDSAQKVIAYEIEKKLEDYWNKKLQEYSNLHIIWGNAITNIKNKEFEFKGKYKVIANLPYQITSHILRTLLELENKPEKIVVMVQKEVAERICEKPGNMSLLAVSVQYYGEPKIVLRVSRGNFWPEPKVDSAVLSIQIYKHTNIQTSFDKKFFEIVKAGFANKRKQLWRNLSVNLKIDGEKIKKALLKSYLKETVRAQELSLEQWKKLCGFIL